jgi:hypothetical protein
MRAIARGGALRVLLASGAFVLCATAAGAGEPSGARSLLGRLTLASPSPVPDEAPDRSLAIRETSEHGLRFVYTPPAAVLRAHTRADDGDHAGVALDGVTPEIAGADLITVDGVTVPVRSILIALPPEGEPEVTVSLGRVTASGPLVLAVPAHGGRRQGSPFPTTVRVTAPALGDEAAPHSTVVGAYVTQIRAQRVLRLLLAPAAYVARTGTVVWTDRIDVSVSFGSHAVSSAVRSGLATRDGFEEVYARTLLNYADGRAWRVPPDPVRRPVAAGSQGGDSFSSSTMWLRVTVREKGMYALAVADLAAAGLSTGEIASIDPATLRVYTGGGRELNPLSLGSPDDWMTQVAATVVDGNGNGQFDASDYVAFYGWGTHGNDREWNPNPSISLDLWYENPYTDDNVYWITWGGTFGEPVRRIPQTASDATPGVTADSTFTYRLHFEQNQRYDPEVTQYQAYQNGAPVGRFGYRWERWWWKTLTSSDLAAVFDVASLPYVAPSLRVRVRARFWGASTPRVLRCVPYEHNLVLTMNGVEIARPAWNGQTAYDVDTTWFWAAPRETLTFQDLRIVDRTNGCVGDTTKQDVVYLAWYELEYQRRFWATDDWLEFTAPAGPGTVRRFALRGFSAGAHVHVYDVTDQTAPRELLPVATRLPEEQDASVVVQDTLGDWAHRYVATSEERFTHASAVRATIAHLRDTNRRGDYLIVTHPNFLGTANALAAYRSHNVPRVPGAETAIVDVRDAYNEFGWGLADPVAVRNFVSYAYRYWQRNPTTLDRPSYLVLVGDASYDFKNLLRATDGSKSFVPGYVGSGLSSFDENVLSDTWYVQADTIGVAYGGLPDMFVGRLPIRSDAQGLIMVQQKLVPYEQRPEYGTWRTKFLLVADDQYAGCAGEGYRVDPIGWDHTAQSEDVARHVPVALDQVKLYGASYPFALRQCVKRTAHDALLADINEGVVAVNYIGHGWWDVLGHEQYMRISDVPSLSNGLRLPVFIAASCAVGKFDEPSTEGISETAVKLSGGGAIATFSATDLAFSYSNASLDTTLLNDLFPGLTLDDVKPFGVAAVGASLRRANAEQYAVLGDPALQIGVPAREVALQLPQGDSILQGEVATFSGAVLTPDRLVDEGYSGTASVEVRGSVLRVDPDGDGSTLSSPPCQTRSTGCYFRDDYVVSGPVIYRGQVSVASGRFTVQFVVPADSAVLGTAGRVRAYVAPAGDGPRMDAVGAYDRLAVAPGSLAPDDSLDILTLEFPGGTTLVTPDADLVVHVSDTHGINLTDQPGAQINLVLDGTTYDLTESFVYDPGSYTTGTARFHLPNLRLGPHTVQVAASDSYGNRSLYPPTLSPLRFEVGDIGRLALREVVSYPEPSAQGARIVCMLDPRSTGTQLHTSVTVYSISGRRIRTIESDQTPVGNSTGTTGRQIQVLWDGRDADGDEVASGTYLYKVRVRDMSSGATADMVGRGPLFRR